MHVELFSDVEIKLRSTFVFPNYFSKSFQAQALLKPLFLVSVYRNTPTPRKNGNSYNLQVHWVLDVRRRSVPTARRNVIFAVSRNPHTVHKYQ